MRGMQWGPIPCRRSWTSVSESVNAPVPMVATEQNLFGAKDGRVVELFQENHAFFQKLCDLQAAVCHVVSVVCATCRWIGGLDRLVVQPEPKAVRLLLTTAERTSAHVFPGCRQHKLISPL